MYYCVKCITRNLDIRTCLMLSIHGANPYVERFWDTSMCTFLPVRSVERILSKVCAHTSPQVFVEADDDNDDATLHSLALRTLKRGAPLIITGSKDAVNSVVHHAKSLDVVDGWAWYTIELYDITKGKGKYQFRGGLAAIATRTALKAKVLNYISSNQGEFWSSTGTAVAGWVLKVLGLCPHTTRNGVEEPLWVLYFSKSPILAAQLRNLPQSVSCGFAYTGPLAEWDTVLLELSQTLSRMCDCVNWDEWMKAIGAGLPVRVGLPEEEGGEDDGDGSQAGTDGGGDVSDSSSSSKKAAGKTPKPKGKRKDGDDSSDDEGEMPRKTPDTGIEAFNSRVKRAGLPPPSGTSSASGQRKGRK